MSKLGPNHGKRTMRSYFRFRFGDIAQLVEQMTFNHWVQGSSPCVPTRNSTVASRPFNFFAWEPGQANPKKVHLQSWRKRALATFEPYARKEDIV